MALVVQKYGGTSVGTPERIRNCARRILETQRAGNQVVAVVSAMSGVTDNLIKLAREVSPNQDPAEREMDVLLATGEQTTIALTAMAINDLGGKAVSLTGAEPVPVPGWAGGAVRVSAGGSEVELTRIGLDGAAVQPARVVPASEAHLGRLGGRGVLEFTATRSSGDDGLVVCLGNDGGDTVELSLGGWQNKSTTLALTADGIGNEIDGPHQGHRLLTGVPIVLRLGRLLPLPACVVVRVRRGPRRRLR